MATSIKRRGAVLIAGLLAGAAFLAARPAQAYPQFQFSSGTTRCSQCHYGPAGTGLITSWGRDESADTISLGGDGAFLHGLWAPPSWLALGLDFRLALTRNDVGGPESPETKVFPMQGDIYVRAALSEAFSFYMTIGSRAVVRPVDDTIGGQLGTLPGRILTPNHYLMWRPSAVGPYARIGRFYAPYGIRFVEHIFYVRRYTGYNLYQETYNLSGGYVAEDFEVHATAFMPVPVDFPDFFGASGPREFGGAIYAEKRFGGVACLAAQTRIGIADDEARYQVGAVGKYWVEPARVLLLGEGDFIRQQFAGPSFGQNQFVSYLGATYVMRGVMAGFGYERFQEDLAVSGTGRNAYDLEVNFFPWAHFELVTLARYQTRASAAPTDTSGASLLMFQLHYYM